MGEEKDSTLQITHVSDGGHTQVLVERLTGRGKRGLNGMTSGRSRREIKSLLQQFPASQKASPIVPIKGRKRVVHTDCEEEKKTLKAILVVEAEESMSSWERESISRILVNKEVLEKLILAKDPKKKRILKVYGRKKRGGYLESYVGNRPVKKAKTREEKLGR